MKHRLIENTGLGNPDAPILDNKGKINTLFAGDALDVYFKKEEYLDYSIKKDEVLVGVEPGYQYERLKLVSINREKDRSYFKQGKAWGAYGTQICATTKYFSDYKRKCKFVSFVNRWHQELFG